MEAEETHYAAALGEAARSIHDEDDVDVALDHIVSLAQAAVPGFEYAGLAGLDAGDGDQLLTRVATGDLVHRLTRLEDSTGEGPCLTALRERQVVTVPRMRHDQRWPSYVESAVVAGVRSLLAVGLDVEAGDRRGCLAFYSTSSEGITEEAVDVAKMFASLTGLALAQDREVSDLEQALVSRKTIGMAIGLLMERFGIDEERAFAYLVRESSLTNTKLRDVAAGIVRSANNGGPTHGAPSLAPGAAALSPLPRSARPGAVAARRVRPAASGRRQPS